MNTFECNDAAPPSDFQSSNNLDLDIRESISSLMGEEVQSSNIKEKIINNENEDNDESFFIKASNDQINKRKNKRENIIVNSCNININDRLINKSIKHKSKNNTDNNIINVNLDSKRNSLNYNSIVIDKNINIEINDKEDNIKKKHKNENNIKEIKKNENKNLNQKYVDDEEEDNGIFIMDDPLLGKSQTNENTVYEYICQCCPNCCICCILRSIVRSFCNIITCWKCFDNCCCNSEQSDEAGISIIFLFLQQLLYIAIFFFLFIDSNINFKPIIPIEIFIAVCLFGGYLFISVKAIQFKCVERKSVTLPLIFFLLFSGFKGCLYFGFWCLFNKGYKFVIYEPFQYNEEFFADILKIYMMYFSFSVVYFLTLGIYLLLKKLNFFFIIFSGLIYIFNYLLFRISFI